MNWWDPVGCDMEKLKENSVGHETWNMGCGA